MTRLEMPSADLDDIRDAALFRFWCKMASYPEGSPSKVMRVLMKANTPDDYRSALYKLALSEGVNLP